MTVGVVVTRQRPIYYWKVASLVALEYSTCFCFFVFLKIYFCFFVYLSFLFRWRPDNGVNNWRLNMCWFGSNGPEPLIKRGRSFRRIGRNRPERWALVKRGMNKWASTLRCLESGCWTCSNQTLSWPLFLQVTFELGRRVISTPISRLFCVRSVRSVWKRVQDSLLLNWDISSS